MFERLDGGAAEGDDALFVAFAADLGAGLIEVEILFAEGADFADAEASGVEEFEDGVVAESEGVGIGGVGGVAGALEHVGDFAFGEGFGEDLPGGRCFDVDGGVVLDALVEQEPAEEAAEATELAGDGAGLDGVAPQAFHEGADVGLGGGEEEAVVLLEVFGELFEVAAVGLAGGRAHAFFYLEVGAELPDCSNISRELARTWHRR